MYYHPLSHPPIEELSRREKLFKSVAWIFNMPVFWLIWGFLIANVFSINMIVEIFEQLDKSGICK